LADRIGEETDRPAALGVVSRNMEFKQGTFDEILESERQMVLLGEERYGRFYTHARECSLFLGHFLKSIDPDRWIFASFLSLVKKHHTLALFSTLRLHQIQSALDLRQTLEAGALAAFAIASPEGHHFVTKDAQGFVNHSKELVGRIYSWLDKNYPAGSNNIKQMKRLINESAAHANLLYTLNTFQTSEKERAFVAPFFDFEDAHMVKTDLWRIANAAVGILDLFYGVNQPLNVIKFVEDFEQRFNSLAQQNNALREEMMATDRYKKAMETLEGRNN
jgi:hypothetical protein